jgi:hypothetical protein
MANSRPSSARPDQPLLGDAHALEHHFGEDIHRVAHHDDLGVLVVGLHAADDVLHDSHVGPGQVQPGLPRPPVPARRHHDHIRVPHPFIALGTDLHALGERDSVAQVLGLAQGFFLVGVDDADGVAAALHEQGVGHRRPHVARADDGNFHV